MSSLTISSETLNRQIESGDSPVLLYVLSDEAFAEKRIPGSLHCCVYEVAFSEKARELLSDRHDLVVVYGLNDKFGGADLAISGLLGAGYANVRKLEGGLDAWEAAGFPVEGDGESPNLIEDAIYEVDSGQSVFRWTGRNLFNQHNGRLAIKSGQLEIRDGQIAGGAVVLDMTKISCSDIKDESLHKVLVNHLESDDFFNVYNHPEARFELAGSSPIPDAKPGGPNVLLSGNLTLRGITKPVEFEAQLARIGEKLGLQGRFDLNRTEYGSVYGSGNFFEKLGQHVVNDIISVSFQLICPV